MNRRNNDTQGDILRIVKEMPGLTSSEIIELMPHVSRSTTYSTISRLYNLGVLYPIAKQKVQRSNGTSIMANCYAVSDNPTPLPKKMKMQKPSAAGYEARIEEFKAKIAELEEWKKAAIERFPDLAVPSTVIRARALVAEEVAAGGDTLLADQIRKGLKDATLMVRVAIRALEEVE